MNKVAVITGVGGMDGYYLSKYLLSIGYRVIGITRRSAGNNEWRLASIKSNPNFELMYGDITDQASISCIVYKIKPDEFYHLAANSFVGCSWKSPSHVIETNTTGTINCLESIRQNKKDCRFYFAASSEMYGNGRGFLNEESPMNPASPYGVSKLAGYHISKVYRKSYDMFVSCGILFNHSAPLRGEEFFTRKVTKQLAEIKHGLRSKIQLGNLYSERDEGYSGDYVKAMHLMLNHSIPDDFVIATGETHSCSDWLNICLDYFNLPLSVIEVDASLFRPNEINVLWGDAFKAREILGWNNELSYEGLAELMCKYDMENINGKSS